MNKKIVVAASVVAVLGVAGAVAYRRAAAAARNGTIYGNVDIREASVDSPHVRPRPAHTQGPATGATHAQPRELRRVGTNLPR